MPAMRNDPLLKECALFDLQRASRVVTSLYNARLRGSGITIAQFSLMRSIEALQPVGMARLARAMAMDRTSVTRVIEPLVASGLLTTSVGEDRRVRNLALTAQGSASVRGAKKRWEKAQRQLFGALGDRRWRALRTALRTTVRSVRELEPSASATGRSRAAAWAPGGGRVRERHDGKDFDRRTQR